MSGRRTKLPKDQTQVAFRLPDDMIERLTAYRTRMEAQMPGIRLTMADAVRALLVVALEQVESRRRGK